MENTIGNIHRDQEKTMKFPDITAQSTGALKTALWERVTGAYRTPDEKCVLTELNVEVDRGAALANTLLLHVLGNVRNTSGELLEDDYICYGAKDPDNDDDHTTFYFGISGERAFTILSEAPEEFRLMVSELSGLVVPVAA
jgi:hypothetical protein